MNKANNAFRRTMNTAPDKLGTFKITAKVIYHTGGTVITKSALPAPLQGQAFPVYMFLDYDYISRFIGRTIFTFPSYNASGTNPQGVWLFSGLAIVGGTTLLGFAGSGEAIKAGDHVYTFVGFSGGTFSAEIIISCVPQSLDSMSRESSFLPITTRKILYFTDNIANWNEPILIVKTDQLGKFDASPFYPLKDKNITDVQPDFIEMQIREKISRYVGLYTRLLFDTNTMLFEYVFIY
jgi:hypothetical protein